MSYFYEYKDCNLPEYFTNDGYRCLKKLSFAKGHSSFGSIFRVKKGRNEYIIKKIGIGIGKTPDDKYNVSEDDFYKEIDFIDELSGTGATPKFIKSYIDKNKKPIFGYIVMDDYCWDEYNRSKYIKCGTFDEYLYDVLYGYKYIELDIPEEIKKLKDDNKDSKSRKKYKYYKKNKEDAKDDIKYYKEKRNEYDTIIVNTNKNILKILEKYKIKNPNSKKAEDYIYDKDYINDKDYKKELDKNIIAKNKYKYYKNEVKEAEEDFKYYEKKLEKYKGFNTDSVSQEYIRKKIIKDDIQYYKNELKREKDKNLITYYIESIKKLKEDLDEINKKIAKNKKTNINYKLLELEKFDDKRKEALFKIFKLIDIIHKKGILIRDMRMANVMYRYSYENGYEFTIIDFGISKSKYDEKMSKEKILYEQLNDYISIIAEIFPYSNFIYPVKQDYPAYLLDISVLREEEPLIYKKLKEVYYNSDYYNNSREVYNLFDVIKKINELKNPEVRGQHLRILFM